MNPVVDRCVLIVAKGDQVEVRDVRSDQCVQMRARSIIIRLERGARLSYFDLQQLSDTACELTVMTVVMDMGSIFTYEGLQCGARYAKTIINLILHGVAAQATLRVGSLATGDQRHCFVTNQQHRSPRTVSSCVVRAAVYDNAFVQYFGAIVVDEHAQKSVAHQQHKSLLMSGTARSLCKPSLAIKAHDVQCGHGSATGQLDDEQLFYLQCRGVERDAAHQLLVNAFFDELYDDEQLCSVVCSRMK